MPLSTGHYKNSLWQQGCQQHQVGPSLHWCGKYRVQARLRASCPSGKGTWKDCVCSHRSIGSRWCKSQHPRGKAPAGNQEQLYAGVSCSVQAGSPAMMCQSIASRQAEIWQCVHSLLWGNLLCNNVDWFGHVTSAASVMYSFVAEYTAASSQFEEVACPGDVPFLTTWTFFI